MAKYTYADVIIDPEDPRIEFGKGKEYYFGCLPRYVLEKANTNSSLIGELIEIRKEDDYPFVFKGFTDGRCCIIRKKESEYVPFDLSKEEDREKLRGAWIRNKNEWKLECFIYEFYESCIPEMVCCAGTHKLCASELFKDWTFLDGTPCGRLV